MIGHYRLFSREGRWVYLKANKDADFPYCAGPELGFGLGGWFVRVAGAVTRHTASKSATKSSQLIVAGPPRIDTGALVWHDRDRTPFESGGQELPPFAGRRRIVSRITSRRRLAHCCRDAADNLGCNVVFRRTPLARRLGIADLAGKNAPFPRPVSDSSGKVCLAGGGSATGIQRSLNL